MRLDFQILADDGVLEARVLDRVYSIFQLKDTCKAVVISPVNGETLVSGDLYECLDACNRHAYDILNRKILDVDKELIDCSYQKINEPAFKDHNGEYAAVMQRRFKSLISVRSFIEEQSREAIVYVYDLQEYHIIGDVVWYYLKCAIRKK